MNTMAPIISLFFLFVFTPSENKKKRKEHLSIFWEVVSLPEMGAS
jgi:hypothetical protein